MYKTILAQALVSFLFLFLTPSYSYADTIFTVANMDFNSSTGEFSFDYNAGGQILNHQITLRSPYNASLFNFDTNNGYFTCTSSHCTGTYTNDKSNFTCFGTDYRIMSTTYVNGEYVQYTSNSLTAEEFSNECSKETTLNVPPLKQTDSLWANEIYDSANIWAPLDPTIGRWGCAITSATMVLNYHNINKLPDGSLLTPSNLNTFLLSTPGGYKRNGATNWERIAAMTKAAKSVNPDFSFDALKYLKGNNNISLVEEDINGNIPDILEVALNSGQHFVVAKHVEDSDILINDPGFERDDLSEYGNSFVSTRRFIPTNTDLSYLVFDVDPNISLSLKDSDGNLVSQGEIEHPIGDPLDLITTSNTALRVISIPEPDSGEYELVVSGQEGSSYTLDQYFYDVDGELKLLTVNGILNNGTNTYLVSFDKGDSINSNSQLVEEVTLSTVREDIEEGYLQMNLGFGLRTALLALLDNAEKAKKPEISMKMFDQMLYLISKDKKIAFNFAQDLIEDINILKGSL